MTRSPFSAVDQSDDAARLVHYLDDTAGSLQELKSRITTLLGIRRSHRILDLGCGAGHDLVAISEQGALAVGLDPSEVMIQASHHRVPTALLIRGTGANLPFADGSFDGCRIERVLQHVDDPARVIAEVRRVVRLGGGVVVMEPDWGSLAVEGGDPRLSSAFAEGVRLGIKSPMVGRALRRLLVDAGFGQVDVSIDAPAWLRVETIGSIFSIPRAIEHAVNAGLAGRDELLGWLADVQRLSDRGAFYASTNRVICSAAIA